MRLKQYITELSMKTDTWIDVVKSDSSSTKYKIAIDNPDYLLRMNFMLYIWSEDFYDRELLGDEKHTAWNIDFTDDEGHVNKNTKTPNIAIKLFAAIEDTVSKFVKKKKPEVIKIISADNDPKRLKLYELLSKKIEKTGKYKLFKVQSIYWKLVRKDLLK